MSKQDPSEKKPRKGVSRRDFMKKTATAGTATVAGIAGKRAAGARQPAILPGDLETTGQSQEAGRTASQVPRKAILFAIGDTLIPSAPGDPGYRDLEWHGISDEVDRRLEDVTEEDLDLFNKSCVALFQKSFTELTERRRAEYFNLILKEGSLKDDKLQEKLRAVYDLTREAVFTIYYQNFPQNRWPQDSNSVPLLRPGDTHQITNPNSLGMFTGWDRAGYAGPLTWEEEQRRRSYFKKIRWQD